MNSFGYRPWRDRPWREAIALKSRIGDTDQPIQKCANTGSGKGKMDYRYSLPDLKYAQQP
jgi:hypothetical protein